MLLKKQQSDLRKTVFHSLSEVGLYIFAQGLVAAGTADKPVGGSDDRIRRSADRRAERIHNDVVGFKLTNVENELSEFYHHRQRHSRTDSDDDLFSDLFRQSKRQTKSERHKHNQIHKHKAEYFGLLL